MDKTKAKEIFNEEYIREKARIAYRSDLEKAKAERKNKWHPATTIGIVCLIIFFLAETWDSIYAIYAVVGVGVTAIIYYIIRKYRS